METIEGVALLLILIITLTSYQGLKNEAYLEKYAFEVDGILIRKEYYRLFSAGFVHLNWLHLLFNMASLYSFCFGVGTMLGVQNFLVLYFVSLLAGNLMALYIHRHHGDYSAVGASGAVSGVIFATIVLFPEAHIGFPFLPLQIPNWAFGIGYLLISLYAIKVQAGTIGHEAHVGGAIAGVVTVVCMQPMLLQLHPWLIAALIVPFFAFMFLLVKRPAVLLVESYWGFEHPRHRRNEWQARRAIRQEEDLNVLLDKVGRRGIQGLSKREKQKLEDLSKNIN